MRAKDSHVPLFFDGEPLGELTGELEAFVAPDRQFVRVSAQKRDVVVRLDKTVDPAASRGCARRARPIASLQPLVRLTRRLLLRELRRYRRGGRFPKNRTHPGEMTPIFIDDDGTRCAMAHLLEIGGAAGLVAEIAHEQNFGRIRELAHRPELVAWLDAAGLTVEEAARIQPS